MQIQSDPSRLHNLRRKRGGWTDHRRVRVIRAEGVKEVRRDGQPVEVEVRVVRAVGHVGMVPRVQPLACSDSPTPRRRMSLRYTKR